MVRRLATKASNFPDREAARACTGSVSGLNALAFENTSRTSAMHSFAVLKGTAQKHNTRQDQTRQAGGVGGERWTMTTTIRLGSAPTGPERRIRHIRHIRHVRHVRHVLLINGHLPIYLAPSSSWLRTEPNRTEPKRHTRRARPLRSLV